MGAIWFMTVSLIVGAIWFMTVSLIVGAIWFMAVLANCGGHLVYDRSR